MCSFLLEQQGGFLLWEVCPCQDKVHFLKKGDVESITLSDEAVKRLVIEEIDRLLTRLTAGEKTA